MSKKTRKGMDIIVKNVDASSKTISINVAIDGAAPAAPAMTAAPATPANRAARRSDTRTTSSNRPQFNLPEGQRLFRCLAIHPENSTTCVFSTIPVDLVGGGVSMEAHAAIGSGSAMSSIPGLTNNAAYELNGLRCPACAAANVPFEPASAVTCQAAMNKAAKKANTTAAVPSQGSTSTDTSTGTLSAADLVASAAAQIAANLGTDRIPEDNTDPGNASTSALA